MDEYKVGALCDSIASKGKKKKTSNGKSKKESLEIQPQSKVSSLSLPENEDVKKSKKRKSKKNLDESVAKKSKVVENTSILQSKIEAIETKSEKHNNKNQITNNPEPLEPKTKIKKTKQKIKITNSVENEPKAEKKLKKKKSKDNSTIPNGTSKTVGMKNTVPKSQDIKSSTDYIEKESRTVFVGNVPVNVKMSAVKNVFKQFGEIETTRLRSVAVKNLDVPKRVSIMKGDFHPQRDTANVYVRFKTIEQAQKALALNATQFEGHTIRVDMALSTGHKQNKKKGIFIGNLPYSIQEDEIWDFFKDCGTITAVRVVRDNMTGVSKGFGYVDFDAKESVEFAIQLQGKRIQNRDIRIKRIETKTNTNKVFNKKPMPFKRPIKPTGMNSQNFQGEIVKPKMQKKKLKPTKTDLMRKKIAKQLNA